MIKEGTPVMMHFLQKEKGIAEPKFNRSTQTHELKGEPMDYVANMTTTAIPNHRDTA